MKKRGCMSSKADHHCDDDKRVRSKAQNRPIEENPEPKDFQSMVISMLGDLQGSMQSMTYRIEELEAQRSSTWHKVLKQSTTWHEVLNHVKILHKGREIPHLYCKAKTWMTPSPAANSTSKNWADRDDEEMDYSTDIDPDDDFPDSKDIKLFKVAEKTEKFLSTHFTAVVSNQTRRQWRDKYGAPNTLSLPVQAWIRADCPVKVMRQTIGVFNA